MIHIIGTAHSTQCWSDAVRKNEAANTCRVTVRRFESYLRDAATSLNATVIAEEFSRQLVDKLPGGSSVAEKVPDELGLRHAYCDPDLEERTALNVTNPEDREPIWMERIRPFSPNDTSIIFVCGATHSVSFHLLIERNGIYARIHCQDFMQIPQAPYTEDEIDEINKWRRKLFGNDYVSRNPFSCDRQS
jgi:hypothetical protein